MHVQHQSSLNFNCYSTIVLILCNSMNSTTHGYSDRVGLLIQNRTTGHYAPKFTVTVHVIIQVIYNTLMLVTQLMSDNTILRSPFQEACTPFISINGTLAQPLAASTQ